MFGRGLRDLSSQNAQRVSNVDGVEPISGTWTRFPFWGWSVWPFWVKNLCMCPDASRSAPLLIRWNASPIEVDGSFYSMGLKSYQHDVKE